MAIETRPCAAIGCRAPCPSSHLMCVAHWRMVPAPLRREVLGAYRRWRSALERASRRRNREQGCTPYTFKAARDLQESQGRAIAAVQEKEIRKAKERSRHQDSLLPP